MLRAAEGGVSKHEARSDPRTIIGLTLRDAASPLLRVRT
jgi:hypothetical protein